MMHRVWTEQQTAVLQGSGQMVVSASAGSGKTAVMIEKIKNLIVNGAKVEEILALTFTRASAAEMKQRLQNALQTEIASMQDSPLQRHLCTELDEIEHATITTIDSFCNTLVQKNFFRLEGVAPNFSILTEEDDWLHKLQNRAMHLALQEWLKERETDRYIADFCKIFAKNSSFSGLYELVLQGYTKVRNREGYLQAIQDMPTLYTKEHFHQLLQQHLLNCIEQLQQLEVVCDNLYTAFCAIKENVSDKFFSYILELGNFCKSCKQTKGYTALIDVAQNFTFERMPTYRAPKDIDFLLLEQIKGNIEQLKATVKILKECKTEILLYADGERALNNFYQSGKLTEAFCKLVLLFDRFFTAQKTSAAKLEFIDLSHLANTLLEQEEVQKELQEQYHYLFVDEYQDTSPIQESILQKLGIENFCMVGDLKQSIYGFRGCTPEIMQKKMEDKEQYTLYALNQNFRSRKSIIDFVNAVFADILPYYDEMYSAIEPEEQAGIFSYSYLPKEQEVQNCNSVYSVVENLTPQVESTQEAELVYAIVCDYVDRMQKSTDKSAEECYGDIVLLTRSRDENIENIIAFLTEKGIPITTDKDINICTFPEIKELINILEYIDNRQQDIPLVAFLKSGLIDMTDEELITIKQSGRFVTFYQACAAYKKSYQDDIAKKLDRVEVLSQKLQNMAKIKSCNTVLEYLLVDEGLEFCMLASGGKNSIKYATNRQKLMRIERLLEACATCSVGEFLHKLRLQGGKILYKPSGGQNSVQIMTVHQSKGLEYPVVILVGLESYLARNEQRDKFKYDAQYGFYFDAYNTEKFTKEKTILSRLAREVQIQKAVEDQKRIFYVAMTRAKTELHIVCKKTDKKFNILKEYAQFSDFLSHIEMEKWDRTASLVVSRGNQFLQEESLEMPQRVIQGLPLTAEEMEAFASFYQKEYAHPLACKLPIKSSATALKQMLVQGGMEEEEVDESVQKRLFTTGESVVKGLAYHAFLEHVDFTLPHDRYEAEIDRVLQSLPVEYQQVLEREKMLQILQLPIFTSLQNATLYKERAFLLQVQARELAALQTEVQDSMLLQGIIDLLAIQQEQATIVDYKYSAQSIEKLQERYRHQMQIYKLAVQKAYNVKQIECYLLNIKSGEMVKIEKF